ncbi:chemotaxis protein CheB [Ectothiorhodospira marina]|uniref:protein-glutamate O-methyltransferase n=1 Tax=Ectothiorhodospira marina TaxID=1396821 RepID=A0A1H7NT90_9GAMM|nr:chemotaxis protein CheB [Ectothiorhodospira marina]SEL26157.1 two-component system, chemotaxis family, CheB/CheR fusion protein [Ectothiorhodospira marina]
MSNISTQPPGKTSRESPSKERPDSSPPAESAVPESAPVIVGVGASAGGLEAIEQFLAPVPADCALAFVVVQHLPPGRSTLLPELLQKITPLTVREAEDRMPVRSGEVYVIPPGKDLSVLHSRLQLLDPPAERGVRLPIDFFLRSLATDEDNVSIGVILSGTGSDGTLGMRAIRDHGGLTLAQSPEEAQFPGMPRSVIDAGVVDVVLPVAAMFERIIDFLQRRQQGDAALWHPRDAEPEPGLEKIIVLLRARTGHDFSHYKTNTLCRRIERRMGLHQLENLSGYIQFLRGNPQELDLLFQELLIGVTNFFRDPGSWEALEQQVLIPMIQGGAPEGRTLRAWVVGCSTGEEAYSLAIAFREALDKTSPAGEVTLQIFASDLNEHAIDQARKGIFPANIAADVAEPLLSKYFQQEAGGYRVNRTIREAVVFATQNVIMDPPFTKLDLLTCRNVLIYLDIELQNQLLRLFHYSLLPGGVLFLGNAEGTGRLGDLFLPVDKGAHLFRRGEGRPSFTDTPFKGLSPPEDAQETAVYPISTSPDNNLQTQAERLILDVFAPPAVLINADGDILYIFGRIVEFLEPAAGKANWNIHVMARGALAQELDVAIPEASSQGTCVTRLVFQDSDQGQGRAIRLTLHPIQAPQDLAGMLMISFLALPPELYQDQAHWPVHEESRRVRELEQALHQTREELRATREFMQTSQEELRSANEELQSTNEELTTSKEEMQSLNEELQTVNAELQAKLEELTEANSDMNNLFNSTDIATVFLSSELTIRRFTSPARQIFKLLPGDVGRPLSDIVTDLDYPDLLDNAREVLNTLMFSLEEISTHDGRWYQVKIMPYRTLDDVISGVVITFSDITKAKVLESRLRALTPGSDNTGEAGKHDE